MKKCVLYSFLVVVFFSCTSTDSYEFRIDDSFSKKEIEELLSAAAVDGINIQLDKLIYSSGGRIKEIKGTVKSRIQSGSFSSSNFNDLVIESTNDRFSIQIN
jgi:hypothetical protein